MGLFKKSPEKKAKEEKQIYESLKGVILSQLKLSVSVKHTKMYDEVYKANLPYSEYQKKTRELDIWAETMNKNVEIIVEEFVTNLEEARKYFNDCKPLFELAESRTKQSKYQQ